MTDVVVMAHGRQERLPELAIPKHCLSLGVETILERTLRLVRELGAGRVGLCAPKNTVSRLPLASLRGVRWRPATDPVGTLIESMQAAALSPVLDAQLFLLGDVVWSRPALTRVMTVSRDAPEFFGRTDPNPFTGKMYGELFAVRVDPTELAPHLGCAMLWALKAALHAPMVRIVDWTDDIDTPEDLAERLPKLREFAAAEF